MVVPHVTNTNKKLNTKNLEVIPLTQGITVYTKYMWSVFSNFITLSPVHKACSKRKGILRRLLINHLI